MEVVIPMSKWWLMVAFIVVMTIYPFGFVAASSSEPLLQSPDSIRIPSEIELLVRTPFYETPVIDEDSVPSGWLAPQAGVEVIGVPYGWSSFNCWWKIQTWQGEKWIYLHPWDLDVDPPETIALFSETPLFPSQNVKQTASATLAPQVVEVVEAEPKWFYGNDSSEKKWIKVRTTFIGDQWIHIPMKEIGTVREADYYVYYDAEFLLEKPDFYEYSKFLVDVLKPYRLIRNEVVHVIGEWVSAHDTQFLVETEDGGKYASSKGPRVEKTSEQVVLSSRTPLFSKPGADSQYVIATLHPQKVDAFEVIRSEIDPVHNMYHISTEFGDGWIIPYYAEPAQPTPIQDLIEVNSRAQLSSLPKPGFQIEGASLYRQTVRPSFSWRDEWGAVWYQLKTDDSSVWFTIEPLVDRIRPQERKPFVQMVYNHTNLNTIEVLEDGLYYRNKKVGYIHDGHIYIKLTYLEERFGYTLSRESNKLVMEASSDGYSFTIDLSRARATTFWNSHEQDNIALTEMPKLIDDEIFLRSEDAEALMGVMLDWFKSGLYFYLFTDEFELEYPETLPKPQESQYHISLYLYDRVLDKYSAQPSRRPMLYIEPDAQTEESLKANMEYRGTLSRDYSLSVLSLDVPLESSVKATIKIGSRIIWQAEYEVTKTVTQE
jgi:hypothetical protein